MSVTEIIINTATTIIASGGYSTITLLMAAESMILPIPSEAITPFAGFLVSQGKFNFVWVVVASTIGSLIGSLASYYVGKYGGNTVIKRFGKYVLLNEEHLVKTEKFFVSHGRKTVFIGRLIPVVRHFISIPAGIAKMKLPTFILYTTMGAAVWNSFLIWVGYILGDNWESIKNYTRYMDIIVATAIIAFIAWHFVAHRKRKNSKTAV